MTTPRRDDRLGTRQAAGISAGTVELALGTSTAVPLPGLRPRSIVLVQPATAAAVTAAPWVSAIAEGLFTITHLEVTGPGAVVRWVAL